MTNHLDATTSELTASGEPTVQRNVVLPNGVVLRDELFQELRRQVTTAIPTMPPDVDLNIRKLVSPDFWGQRSRRERIALGHALAHLVTSHQLSLRFVSCLRCSSKVYRRT